MRVSRAKLDAIIARSAESVAAHKTFYNAGGNMAHNESLMPEFGTRFTGRDTQERVDMFRK